MHCHCVPHMHCHCVPHMHCHCVPHMPLTAALTKALTVLSHADGLLLPLCLLQALMAWEAVLEVKNAIVHIVETSDDLVQQFEELMQQLEEMNSKVGAGLCAAEAAAVPAGPAASAAPGCLPVAEHLALTVLVVAGGAGSSGTGDAPHAAARVDMSLADQCQEHRQCMMADAG